MPIKKLKLSFKTLHKTIQSESYLKLKRLAPIAKNRAKKVHKYKNRSWNLTNKLAYRIDKKKLFVRFRSMYYGQWIIDGTARSDGKKDNYIKNAWSFAYRKDK